MPERSLLRIARNAKNVIEQAPGVLSAELRGSREEAVEVIVEPMLLRSYGVSLDQLIATVNSSNSLIAAGALEGDTGRFAVKVPGLIEKPQDVLKVPVGTDGFFNEIHPKLRPVETVVDGVMIAGCCQSPRTVSESVAAGLAAVAQSAALLKKGYAELEPLVARVDPEKCAGSGECLSACPYDSITSIEWDGRTIASVDPATCKGCGGCIPVCPSDAIDLLGYTDAQMRAAIEELLETDVPVKEPVA